MTLNGVKAVILRISPTSVDFGADYVKWLKIHLYFPRQKCSARNLALLYITYGDIRGVYGEQVRYREAPERYRFT